MRQVLTERCLRQESDAFVGTGGTSSENCSCGFKPAFLDTQTGSVYTCRHADGRPATVHLLDGLPPDMVLARAPSGQVTAVKGSLVAGFIQEGRFYTREEAARWVLEMT